MMNWQEEYKTRSLIWNSLIGEYCICMNNLCMFVTYGDETFKDFAGFSSIDECKKKAQEDYDSVILREFAALSIKESRKEELSVIELQSRAAAEVTGIFFK